MKQLQIGKARPEYQRYIREVPPHRRTSSHPLTPDPRAHVSKRQFDRALGEWRRRLHEFDAVPRAPPRETEAARGKKGQQQAVSSSKKAGRDAAVGLASEQQLQQEQRESVAALGRSSNRPRSPPRERRGRASGIHVERSTGKFGPRKPIDGSWREDCSDSLDLTDASPPPPPPKDTTAHADSAPIESGAVMRISLADQLMGMQQQQPPPPPSLMPAPPFVTGQWFENPEMSWSSMETPEKSSMMGALSDLSFMMMETPADKPMMPGHAMVQPFYDGMLGCGPLDETFSCMPVESLMIPHKLFDSSPACSEQEQVLDGDTSAGDSDPSPKPRARSESPRRLAPKADSEAPTPMKLGFSPMPRTPLRLFGVETPSPDRLHIGCSLMQQPALPPPQPFPQIAAPCPPCPPWLMDMPTPGGALPQVSEFMQMIPWPTFPDGQVPTDLVQCPQ